MISLFIIKPRVKKYEIQFMIFLLIIKPRAKKLRNTIHDIPVYDQTSCKNSKKYNS